MCGSEDGQGRPAPSVSGSRAPHATASAAAAVRVLAQPGSRMPQTHAVEVRDCECGAIRRARCVALCVRAVNSRNPEP